MKTLAQLKEEITKRYKQECCRHAEDVERALTREEEFMLEELAMLNHFVDATLNGVMKKLGDIEGNVTRAIQDALNRDRRLQ